jgi:transcriptional regulator with XRE-family HTH domain
MALAPNQIFGKYLKTLRLSRNVTIEEVSKQVGLPTLFIMEVEEGRRAIPSDFFNSYPIAVGVPVRVLMQEYLNAQLGSLCRELGIAVERCELTIATAH